jgi:hypothetical protein
VERTPSSGERRIGLSQQIQLDPRPSDRCTLERPEQCDDGRRPGDDQPDAGSKARRSDRNINRTHRSADDSNRSHELEDSRTAVNS